MKHLRNWLIAGALAVNMIGFAALVSAQDPTAVPDTTEEAETAAQPYLGIVFEGTEGGVTVVDVLEDGPAAAAGLAADDVITAIDGAAVTEENFRDTILTYAAGDTVSLAVTRGEEQLTLDVTLGEAPATLVMPGRNRPDIQMFRLERPRLGIGIDDSDNGVVVTSVNEGSPAEAAGVQVDDVLTAINGTPVATAEEAAQAVADAVDAAEVGEFTVDLTVSRGEESLDLTATLVKSDMPAIPGFPNMPGGRGDGRGFGFNFGMPGFNIVPREGEEGAFDVVVPFTPADPAAVTQDVIDALAAIGIGIAPREGEEGVFDLTIPAESLGRGGMMLPDLQSILPEGFGMFDFHGPMGRNFRFEIPNIPGGADPAQPETGGSL